MIANEQHRLLKDIICNTERTDKMTIKIDFSSRSMSIEYDDLDDEWLKEMVSMTPNAELTGTARLYAQCPATEGSGVERFVRG